MSQDAASPASTPIQVERSYNAEVEDLWALWTTNEGFEAWWGPEGYRVEVHELDLRVGGALVYDMIADAPEQIEYMKQSGMAPSHATRGRFTEVAPLRTLEILHVIDFIPGLEPYDNRIRVEFSSEDGRASMAVTIEPHPDPEWTRTSIKGFESQLTKVPAALAARMDIRAPKMSSTVSIPGPPESCARRTL